MDFVLYLDMVFTPIIDVRIPAFISFVKVRDVCKKSCKTILNLLQFKYKALHTVVITILVKYGDVL